MLRTKAIKIKAGTQDKIQTERKTNQKTQKTPHLPVINETAQQQHQLRCKTLTLQKDLSAGGNTYKELLNARHIGWGVFS